MPLPAAAIPILADVGIRAGGAVLARIIGGKRKELDLTTPAINEAQASLSDLQNDQRRQQMLLEADLARVGSAGFSGAAARQNLLDANAKGGAAIRGSILDTLANARMDETIANTEAANQERANRIAGIVDAAGSVASGVSDAIGQKNLIKDLTALRDSGNIAANPLIDAGIAQAAAPNSFQALQSTFNAQSSFPIYGQLMDYGKISKRMFNNIQTQ